MATDSSSSNQLATQARRLFAETVLRQLPMLVQEVSRWVSGADRDADFLLQGGNLMHLHQTGADFKRQSGLWQQAMSQVLVGGVPSGVIDTRPAALDASINPAAAKALSLVDDDTIEREITQSRLATAMLDRAGAEYADLRLRLSSLERRSELDANDLVRAHVLARVVTQTCASVGIEDKTLRDLQIPLHREFAVLMQEAYHEANEWLVAQGVLPEIDLRPLIRRAKGASASAYAPLAEETRLMTRSAGISSATAESAASAAESQVVQKLGRLLAREVPGFSDTAKMGAPAPVAEGLSVALNQAQQGMARRAQQWSEAADATSEQPAITPAMLEELQARKQALKRAAETPIQRATIEIVALLFQSILTEERIPAVIRVWFARLQMPVLRVAVSEQDFFATVDHPARRLIDRMGACVMGFEAAGAVVGQALETEVKRVVQVVEAYPDTGRRVFQTVLTEFERFLEHYFQSENTASAKAVSLAQQVEQRETLAIQYTIELRKMLNEMPVQEGVRQFLFHVWADVMAVTAVRHGAQSEATKAMRAAAADLVWSASAKVSRDERNAVIQRLPPLLKKLREGMESAGMDGAKRDEHVKTLNDSLAAAFTAKAAAIPAEQFAELREQLETLEELLPDASDVELDQDLMVDLSGLGGPDGLEVVRDGGSMPTPAMLAWARELQVGSWYMLELGGKSESAQLAWQGLRRHLSLLVTGTGRCYLFDQQRLASYLQAGLLLPAQDESLTVRATRTALAKIDSDPSRLLN
jgi:Protein of unknown function (DUF1631)